MQVVRSGLLKPLQPLLLQSPFTRPQFGLGRNRAAGGWSGAWLQVRARAEVIVAKAAMAMRWRRMVV